MNWLRRLFGIHVHEWACWEVVREYISDWGISVIVQKRSCKTCGRTEIEAVHQ